MMDPNKQQLRKTDTGNAGKLEQSPQNSAKKTPTDAEIRRAILMIGAEGDKAGVASRPERALDAVQFVAGLPFRAAQKAVDTYYAAIEPRLRSGIEREIPSAKDFAERFAAQRDFGYHGTIAHLADIGSSRTWQAVAFAGTNERVYEISLHHPLTIRSLSRRAESAGEASIKITEGRFLGQKRAWREFTHDVNAFEIELSEKEWGSVVHLFTDPAVAPASDEILGALREYLKRTN